MQQSGDRLVGHEQAVVGQMESRSMTPDASAPDCWRIAWIVLTRKEAYRPYQLAA